VLTSNTPGIVRRAETQAFCRTDLVRLAPESPEVHREKASHFPRRLRYASDDDRRVRDDISLTFFHGDISLTFFHGDDDRRYNSEVVGEQWGAGDPLSGIPDVTMLRVEIPPGRETGWHTHPVPSFAYVISGTLTVASKDGRQLRFSATQGLAESVDVLHDGKNLDATPGRARRRLSRKEKSPNRR
jgi:quercetin dioxygenase-like cupin family protein